MSIEAWVSVILAIAGGLAALSYRHPKEFQENILRVLYALTLIVVCVSFLYNIGVYFALSALHDASRELGNDVMNQDALSHLRDAIHATYIPMWFLLACGGAFIYFILLENFPWWLGLRQDNDDQPSDKDLE